ncbi:VIT1/CCC1 transporter family protein [Chlamydia pecorum]|uniref:VIT1/CCC1 transporter family protein n=1 Tax=Chlamydia pecorum TaxID=85991 RepID=UPI0007AF8C9B|nr:VIT1/CCC1 transporter family protein [Chlamydia pecorum]KZN28023.1 VIT family protein [Chlamydia pecorum]
MTSQNHFYSRTPEQHVRMVRDKHGVCKGEPYTTSKGLFYHLAGDALSSGAFLFFIRTLFFLTPLTHSFQTKLLISLGIGWAFYQGAFKAKEAWSYMELSHRSMFQEKEEIERHFDQEKEELRVIFSNQGFKGPLLEDMIEYVCSDTTLLLDIMIREELHICKEAFPHPLTQGGVRMLGNLLGLMLFLPFTLCASYSLAGFFSTLLIVVLSIFKAKILENSAIVDSVWSAGIFLTAISIICSFIKFL